LKKIDVAEKFRISDSICKLRVGYTKKFRVLCDVYGYAFRREMSNMHKLYEI